MKLFSSLLLLALLPAAELTAQQRSGGGYPGGDLKVISGSLFFRDVNGFALNTQQYTELVEGTPFFHDGWLSAFLVLADGKGYEGVPVRLDLLAGPVALYKTFHKVMTRNKRYSSATEEARIQTKERYFLVRNGQLTEVKKFKDAASLLSADEPRLEAYAKELRNGAFTPGQQLDALVARYNQLKVTPLSF